MQPRLLDLNNLIERQGRTLRRLTGEHISITCELAQEPLTVQADPPCLEQVVANLVVNARDAMPEGGRLIIRTGRVTLDEETGARHAEARAGEFARVAVCDSGSGIAPEILPRIFEPFFTTKDVGQGTGLGLATVYGILKQHEGWIEVDSLPGQGSTFTFYLPTHAESAETEDTAASDAAGRGARETVLVLEDEEPVRQLIDDALTQCGYHVLPAGNGDEALAIWKERNGNVDLLLTDMVMPEGASGRHVADTMLAQNPRLKVIYSSGYVGQIPEPGELQRAGTGFLPKPYTLTELFQTVSECLHGTRRDPALLLQLTPS